MKSEFLKLLETNYDNEYVAQIQDSVHRVLIREAFANEDLRLREKHLEEKLLKAIDFSDFKKFAHPYFVGFGNPNSDILVIGKEKAFQANDSTLMIKESINNYCQWKIIAENNMWHMSQCEMIFKLGFNPLLPKSYHSGITKRNHTWGITSSIISQVYPDKNLLLNENNDMEKSFFNNCFLTELNNIPAKYHEGSGLSLERQNFLSLPFFKSFPIVIFSAKSYLKGNEHALTKIFKTKRDPDSKIELDLIGRNKDKPVLVDRYRLETQHVYVCNQLSGASGWSNTSISKFAKLILKDMKASV